MTPTTRGRAPGRAPACQTPSLASGEGGFSIVEVVVAMMVMTCAVLGTTVLLSGAAASTGRTAAQEQGTSLARDLVERSRQIAYDQTAMGTVAASLRATLPAGDEVKAGTGTAFTVKRRNTLYTVDVRSCALDDPTDGAGQGDATFCAAVGSGPTGSTGSAATAAPIVPAASVNVLGVAVSAGGSVLGTVCSALGNPTLFQRVSRSVSTLAPVSVCPEGSYLSDVHFDTQPDDMRRVRIEVSWTRRGKTDSLVQTTLIPNPVG